MIEHIGGYYTLRFADGRVFIASGFDRLFLRGVDTIERTGI